MNSITHPPLIRKSDVCTHTRDELAKLLRTYRRSWDLYLTEKFNTEYECYDSELDDRVFYTVEFHTIVSDNCEPFLFNQLPTSILMATVPLKD